MSFSELQQRLLGSNALKSLLAEQAICATLASHGWTSVHSSFYTDCYTNKLREIDVVGAQTWRQETQIGEISVELSLLIEAKSAAGYHLLFSPTGAMPRYSKPRLHFDYIGYDGNIGNAMLSKREQIKETLTHAGLQAEQVMQFLQQFGRMLFPGKFIVPYNLMVEPAPADLLASAFRETNVKGEKDLDNSVLWKASQSLHSAVTSLYYKNFRNLLSDLSVLVELDIERKTDPVKQALDESLHHASRLSIYHPVIVIDAQLWNAGSNTLQEVSWCRFTQLDRHKSIDWWFDIVQSSYFPDFVQMITHHYKRAFDQVGAKLETKDHER